MMQRAFLLLGSILILGALEMGVAEKGDEMPQTMEATSSRPSSIKAHVLVERPKGAPMPAFSGRGWGLDQQPVAIKSSALKDKSIVAVHIPGDYVRTAALSEYVPRTKADGKRYRCFYQDFGTAYGSLSGIASDRPVVLGIARVLEEKKVDVHIRRKGSVVAQWKGIAEANFYTVSIRAEDDHFWQKLCVCTTNQARFSITRMNLAKTFGLYEWSMGNENISLSAVGMTRSGKLANLNYRLRIDVVGFSKSYVPVYAASSGPVEYVVEDDAEKRACMPPKVGGDRKKDKPR